MDGLVKVPSQFLIVFAVQSDSKAALRLSHPGFQTNLLVVVRKHTFSFITEMGALVIR